MKPFRSPFVQAVDDSFRATLDDLARARGWPTTTDVARLGALVRKLSDAYNDPRVAPPRSPDALAARLLFSFPRDVPKGAGAARELVLSGALTLPEGRPLRVLDVGAGLGATSRGLVRALALRGARGEVVVDAVDADGAALDLASAIARARPREGDVHVELRTTRAAAGATPPGTGYDVIVLGQVLSELDRELDGGRVERHVALLRQHATWIRDDGVLVVVEPALRERTRHLHAVRDALLATSSPAATALHVFAPCTQDDPCPMLLTGDAWCHEDLDVDLPPWLVPIARAAGLRWQGLTFSYLVLRRDGRRHAGGPRPLRVVSEPVVTKGKRELFLCGDFEGEATAARLKVMRIDRHRTVENAAWDEAARGDVLTVQPAVTRARPRVDPSTIVARVPHGD